MTEASTFFLWRLPSWKVSIESLGSFVTAEACVSGLGGLSGFVLIQAAFDWPQLPVEASCSAQEQSILAILFSSLREMLQQHFFINKASWKRFWKGAGMHSTSSQKISFNGPLTTPSHVLLASCSKQWLDQNCHIWGCLHLLKAHSKVSYTSLLIHYWPWSWGYWSPTEDD